MINFSNRYARLPSHFYVRLDPTPVARPRLIRCNHALASELGLDLSGLDDDALASLFAGNVVPPGAEPLAMAYAGHQFGHFVPQLGDGRAILLGEVRDRSGVLRDIQLKGSGRTPYSRGGDGRAALGPVLREYLISEAMHALRIPGTRALAAVTTGEQVLRDGPMPGAVLTRVAQSHLRVGTFQFFAARQDEAALRSLVDYAIERHDPEAAAAERPALALLQGVARRQASLIARWLQVGFIHGVMNTDNMTISGETIDFGPCAFMDAYDPATVFSSIDHAGRYAYGNQPHAAQWNLARLAETLLPLLDADPARALALATEVIDTFPAKFEAEWLAGFRAKLGLASAEDGDLALVESLLQLMQADHADFTLTFRSLCAAADPAVDESALRALMPDAASLDDWLRRWRARMARDPQSPQLRVAAMRRTNPAYIPRNHRVEQALNAAIEHEDYSPFDRLLTVLAHPFDDQPGFAAYAVPPKPEERVLQTFCGT